MNLKQTREMMETAEEHYIQEQRKLGMIDPIPYAFVKNNETGALMIYTPWRKYASQIEEMLKREFIK